MSTATEHRAKAAQHYADAAESFERCDTDGAVSQWASGIMGRLEEAKARLAENGGRAEFRALFNLDGTVASTHEGHGQYGAYWVLNDAAAEAFGKRFFSASEAQKDERRRANNRAKGFTVGTIEVAAYADTYGSGTGLSGALSVGIVIKPNVAELVAGNYTILTTEY